MSVPSAALAKDIVLLVDDSPDALGFLTDALEQSGFSVLIATSGQSALNIAERITPDIILLDAVMPSMDGFETCTRLKSNAAVTQVPVIFMTGLTESRSTSTNCAPVFVFTSPMPAPPKAHAWRWMPQVAICWPCAQMVLSTGRPRRRHGWSMPQRAAMTDWTS
jgi:CheY-like chemotaxis protein